MSPLPPPSLRIKSHWHKPGAQRRPADQARALAFTVWRVALQLLKRMRSADFDIDAGAPYFDFLAEALIFLVAVADRSVHARLGAEDRAEFLQALAAHCADTLDGNRSDLLGPAPAGQPYRDAFIDRLNLRLPEYADFGAERVTAADPAPGAAPGFTPDFGFLRYFGSLLEACVPPKDQRWVLDQVMAIEAPEAVRTVNGALADLLSDAPRPARRSRMLSGD